MTRHLLPCSCSRLIEVAAARAGGTVRCPGCGAQVSVPRLGELTRLAPAAPVRANLADTDPASAGLASAGLAGRGWGSAHACVLVGIVLAAAAAAAAGWLHGRRDAVAPSGERAIAESVATAPADRVYEAWRTYERQGIARPPLVEEERRSRHAGALAALERIAWAVAAGGAGIAAAAAIFVAARRA